MKVTEVLWNSAACRFNDFKTDSWSMDYVNKDRTLFYNRAILRYITGEEVFVTFPEIFSNITIPKTEEAKKNLILFKKKVNDLFGNQDFLDRHNLTPSFKCIVPIMDDTLEEMEEADFDTEVIIKNGYDIPIKTGKGEDIDYAINNGISNGTRLLSNVKTYVTRPAYLFGDDLVAILSHSRFGYIPNVILFTSESADEVANIYNECNEIINWYNSIASNKKKSYTINIATSVSFSRINFSTCKINLKNPISPEEVYNEDFPMADINRFIEDDSGGLCIFYGEPGCGKSTYIKYLSTVFSNKKFYLLPQDLLLTHISDIRCHLLESDGGSGSSIYIIEDCEKLIVSRESKENTSTPILSELLNMSDGIMGDYLNIKFILTFNTQIPKIDKALLRKGRLKLKYEFKPLKGERLRLLAEKRGISLTNEDINNGMTLANVFNHESIVDFSEEEKVKKIGF